MILVPLNCRCDAVMLKFDVFGWHPVPGILFRGLQEVVLGLSPRQDGRHGRGAKGRVAWQLMAGFPPWDRFRLEDQKDGTTDKGWATTILRAVLVGVKDRVND